LNTPLIAAKIKDQQFGIAVTSSDLDIGILGVGPAVGQLTSRYPYVIDSLVAQGMTQSRAFTLDLRSIDSPDGMRLLIERKAKPRLMIV
jgi:hypothetical protein